MQFDQITGTLTYSPNPLVPPEQRLHADLDFHNISWNIHYWHNEASFYDLTGPTDLSRKGDALIVGYQKSFLYDPPQQLDFSAKVGLYTGLDALPGAQNIPTGNDHNIASLRLMLNYTDTNKSLGAVEAERGVIATVAFEPDYSSGGAYPRLRAGVGFGFPTPIEHSSIWIFNAAGVSGGNSANALGSYYLGAFGNNYIDNGEIKRYRDYDSFPGFQIDGITARSFAKTLVEWNLPPVRFSDLGRPSFYLSYARPELFAGVMAAGPPTGGEKTLGTVGGQLDFNFTVALRLPMTFSVGYARGYEATGAPGPDVLGRSHGEVMASLKIL
jgi:hypothetical protein